MRKIKFKVWNKEENCWAKCNESLLGYIIAWKNNLEFYLNGRERYEFFQFTGLQDKNGKEIYEGDIVRIDGWKPKSMQIAFLEGAFCLANKDGEFLGDIHYVHHAGIKQCTILGNIYENSELLK